MVEKCQTEVKGESKQWEELKLYQTWEWNCTA